MSTAQQPSFPSYITILHKIQVLEEQRNHPLKQSKLDVLHAMLALNKLKSTHDAIKVINDTASELQAVYERLCGNLNAQIDRVVDDEVVKKVRSNPKMKYRKRAEELLRKRAQGRKVVLNTRKTRTNKFNR